MNPPNIHCQARKTFFGNARGHCGMHELAAVVVLLFLLFATPNFDLSGLGNASDVMLVAILLLGAYAFKG